jgi:cyclopropane-fatty-acyl-phospholipid synthase
MQEGLETKSVPSMRGESNHPRNGSANGSSHSSRPEQHAGAPSPHTPWAPSSHRPCWKLERNLLERVFRQSGHPKVFIELWDGTVVGDPQTAVGQILIHNPTALRRLLWYPSLAFGECYSDGSLEIRGELIETLIEINRGLSRVRPVNKPPRRFSSLSHSLSRSKSSVHHHYDIGNDFYKLWLDPRLVYTCAYYPTPEATLAQAQVAKLDYVCRKLRLKPGERVAEAGCGWGALAMHMAREYGVSVQAYNLSTEQIQHAREWAAAEGLSDRVQFIQDDYRHMTGEFDAFVSVGMLEHVGPECYRGMGELISRVLTPSGRGLIHSIGRNIARDLDPWTDKYIFPNAYPPSLREMMDIFEGSRLSVLDVENLRLHYARTCADWLANFERHADKVGAMFDERFVRMWRLYLASSSASFATGDLQLFQVVFARAQCNDLPITRSDWYAQPLRQS